jgi:protocatechuate 3,4-dioxygenase beta subunit
MPEQRGERDLTYRPLVKNLEPGEEALLALAPAQILEGTIRFADTGAPAPHARVHIWASQQEHVGSMVSVAGQADDQGRYRIVPYTGVRFGVTAYPPGGAPYLTRRAGEIKWAAGDTRRTVDVTLPRGVLIRGRVLEAPSGAAVVGASIQYVPERLNNPNTTDDILTGWQGIEVSGADGQFEIVVLPGPGRLLVHGPTGEFVFEETSESQLYRGRPGGRRHYAHAILSVSPETDADEIPITVQLQRGATVAGRIVDERGEPVGEALVITRLTIHPHSTYWRGFPIEAMGGRFQLAGLGKEQEYPAHFLDAKRRLGATAVLRAGMEAPTIVLRPCGQAAARFVDREGRPLADFRPALTMVVTPGANAVDAGAARRGELAADEDNVANIDQRNHWSGPQTDAQGRVTFGALIPGATYRILGYMENSIVVAREFTAEAQQTIELGEIVLQRRD